MRRVFRQVQSAPIFATATPRCCSTDVATRLAALEATVAAQSSENNTPAKGTAADKSVPQSILRSIVKIFTNASQPNHLIPWQRKLQAAVTGTGFVVDRKMKLLATNSHVIQNSQFVEVRKHGDFRKFTGYVVYVGADCDLALVQILDPEFWGEDGLDELPFIGIGHGDGEKAAAETSSSPTGIEALTHVGDFDGLPELQQDVKVVGYPLGGDQISITSGVVSRIDITNYGGLGTNLMTIQLDAAINAGNSGGPALSKGRVTGVAFQSLLNAESIGYIIPIPVVSVFMRAFLKSAALRLSPAATGVVGGTPPKRYHPGFCSLGIIYQDMSNKALRNYYSLPKDVTGGILIRQVVPVSAAAPVLKVDDVVLRIGEYDVATDATIEWRPHERIRFNHLVRMRIQGEPLPMVVWRKGERLELTIDSREEQLLVRNHLFSDDLREMPKYRIFGGVVFSTLTTGLLMEWGADSWYTNAPRWLTDLISNGYVTQDRKEVIVVAQVLPHSVNVGYSNLNSRIVSEFNGAKLESLDHFENLLDEAIAKGQSDADATVCVGVGSTTNQVHKYADNLVLPVTDAVKADQEMQGLYQIPHLSHRDRRKALQPEQ